MSQWRTPELRRAGRTSAPLSFAQERLWFVDATAAGSATYNVPLLMRWSEPVDVAALGAALSAVVERHEVLRTTYQVRDGERVQVVGAPAPVEVDVVDLEGTPDGWRVAGEQALDRAKEPFDLASGPPLRCAVWRGVDGGDAMLLTIHHIAIDGWSLAALLTDLATAYDAALAGRAPRLPELPVQYTDFAVWDRAMFADPAVQRLLTERLDELLAVPGDLRLGGARPVERMVEGARPGRQLRFDVPAEVFSGAGELARRLRVTPFVVLLAAFTELLRRWSSRDEFVVGVVTANRGHPDLEQLVGFFVNTVPLRCRVDAGSSFSTLCTRLRADAFRTLSYQRVPLDQLTARAAAGPRGHGRLADIGFALQNMPAPKLGGPPRWSAPSVLTTGTAKFDVTLVIDDTPDGAAGTLEWDTDLYPDEFGGRFATGYLALLAAALAAPDRALGELPAGDGPLPFPRPAEHATSSRESGPAAPAEHERRAIDLFAAVLTTATGATTRHIDPGSDFFMLGGHSLLAVSLLAEAKRRHGVAIAPRDFFGDPTVSGLARLLAAASPDRSDRSGPATTTEPAAEYPATPVQQRLWFFDRIPALRAAYLVPAVVELTGEVDVPRLRAAVDEVLARHPSLRSVFRLDRASRRLMYHTDGPAVRTSVTDARHWDADKLADHVAELCWTPFDLGAGPPARAEILLVPQGTLLVLCAHHLVTDGRSQQALMDQIAGRYRNPGAELPASVHPATWAADPGDEAIARRVAEVVASLRGAPTDVRLPHDRPREGTQPIEGETCSVSLGAELTARLRAATAGLGCSTFMICAALLAATLSRRSGQRDFVFVFPWAGRDDPGSADAVGMFVNTLTLRVDLRGEPTWRELLERVRRACTASYRNADVPFDAVAAGVHPDRDLSRPAVTPVWLAAADGDPVPPALGPGIAARYLRLDPLAVKYELELTATELTDDVRFTASYLTDLFDRDTITGLLTGLVAVTTELATELAAEAAAGPGAPVAKER